MTLTTEQINNVNDVVEYHAPSTEKVLQISRVREATKVLIMTMLSSCPASVDRSAAIRHVREGMMVANASIVLEGRSIT